MSGDDWEKEIAVNLNQPFYLARAAMEWMKSSGAGGRIVLTGTESALHGGSAQSFPYAIAKRGTECMVQGLAREGAGDEILVNGIRLGFITSGFHQRWHNKSETELKERAAMVPLTRGGDVEVTSEVCHGHAPEILCQKADELGASQIYIGRRGRSSMERLLFGSVASSLVQTSPVPVTVVP